MPRRSARSRPRARRCAVRHDRPRRRSSGDDIGRRCARLDGRRADAFARRARRVRSISVRGAAPGHTSVLVDGVPLARLAAVTTDLGRYSLDAFGEVELYRGAVPLELGGAGVGGALNLVTRLGRGEHGERVHASTGAGSYGARHLRARYGDRIRWTVESVDDDRLSSGDGRLLVLLRQRHAAQPQRRRYQTRTNNAFSQVDARDARGPRDRSLVGGARVAWKRRACRAAATQPSLVANMSTLDVLADVRGDVNVGRATARQLGYVLVETSASRDPDGELGLGTQNRGYLTLSGGASSTWSVPLGAHRATAGVELRGDRFRDADRTACATPFVGDREGGAVLAASISRSIRRSSSRPRCASISCARRRHRWARDRRRGCRCRRATTPCRARA